jgi:hypothetical protein
MRVRFDVDPETQRPIPREIEYQDWVNLVVEVEREFGARTARERNNVLSRAGVRPGLHLIIEGVFLKEIAPERNDELFGRLKSPKNPRWDELHDRPNRDYDLSRDVSEFLYAHAAYLAGEARWESMRLADSTIIRSELPIWSWLGRHFDGHFRNTYERDLASKILYLGPMRVVGVRDQKNYPSLSPLTPIGPAGEHLASLLLLKRRLTAKFPMPKKDEMQSVTIIQALNAWQKHLGIDSQVQAEGDKVVGARIRVGRYSLDNVGTGISQVAPVLTLALLAASEGGKTVVLEQPELHLHPSLQRKLADFFYEMSRHNCQFIIETHSEYLVTRLRLLRARADLNGDDLKILFAESKGSKKEGKRAEFRTIDVGEKGYLSEWPEGFLDGVDIDQYAIASIQTLQ